MPTTSHFTKPDGPDETKRVFISISSRLTILVVTLVALVAVGVYVGLVRTSRAEAMRSKTIAVDMVVALTSASVAPAVVFGDEAEIKRAIADLGRNPEVTDVELWRVAPTVDSLQAQTPSDALLGSFHRAGGLEIGRPAEARLERRTEGESMVAAQPVVSLEGNTLAMLEVRFSTQREAAAVAALAREILYVSAGTALCLASAILFLLNAAVVRPLKRLQGDAARLARGDDQGLAESVKSHPRRTEDEVMRLANAFGDMAHAVRDRESRLAIRNADLKVLLDNVDQGFLSASPDGTLLPERSAIAERWLGDLGPDARVWDLTGTLDPTSTGWTRAAWSQLVDGFLPVDFALAQLPKRLARQGRHFELAYHPVMNDETLERVVIVLTDVTAQVERQEAVADQQEFSSLVDQFVRDRRAFLGFWSEASTLIGSIVGDPNATTPEAIRRDLHTLKGNARSFGLASLAAVCHSIEDALAERNQHVLTDGERAKLADLWDNLCRRMDPLLHGAAAFVEISKDEYEYLVDALRRRVSHDVLQSMVRGYRHEPAAWRLERARDTVLAACKKLCKPLPTIVIKPNNLRFPPGRLAQFWTVFSHVLTNAVDHGLELEDERRKAGKPLPATVEISTRIAGPDLVIEVSDDGRGIDWARVRATAEMRGMPGRTQTELLAALLSEGFSLRATVTEMSGRGMGLAAVRAVVTSLGGKIELESALGAGARWRFRFKADWIDADARVLVHAPTSETRLITAVSEAIREGEMK